MQGTNRYTTHKVGDSCTYFYRAEKKFLYDHIPTTEELYSCNTRNKKDKNERRKKNLVVLPEYRQSENPQPSRLVHLYVE